MNPVNGITNSGAAPAVTQKSKVRAESSPTAAATPKGHMDSLELTNTLGQVNAEPGFDAAKVESIKRAIAGGNYPIDARSIAKSFAELEHLVGNSGAR
jgi:negative regulator of flagellin synthesis FlgM